jgi:glycosidase
MLKRLLPLALAAAFSAQAQVDTSAVPAKLAPSALPAHWQQGTFMEVFVRAYQDSNGDGVGDLRGLIQRLDYLKRLGVTGLWLMPIQASADHDHGYATADFRAIEPAYGTLADFDKLIREAHKRDIGVVMDYVVNHASYQHPAFQAALADPKSPWRSWFVWADPAHPEALQGWDIWGKFPWYDADAKPWTWTGELKDLPRPPADGANVFFGTFGPHMPDFNLRNPEVVRYHEDSLRFWLNRDLDGYRLDAVPHLIENNAKDWNDQPESRALTKHLQDLIKSYPNRFVVCEATAEPQAYGDPAVCGGAFAFGLQYDIIKAAKGDAAAVQKMADYYQRMAPTMATFLHNHDIFAGTRVWDQVNGDEARYRLAAASYLLAPGTPFVYYGEEIGLAGIAGKGDDPLRAPMSWSAGNAGSDGFSTAAATFRPLSPNRATHNAAAQARDPASLLNFYRRLLALRQSHPALSRGSYESAKVMGQVWTFQRALAGERMVVAINYGDAPAQVALSALKPGARAKAALGKPASLKVDTQGRAVFTLPPLSAQVYRVTDR